MFLRGKSVRLWCDGSSDRSLMVDPLSYFSFQPVLHDWCNKGRGVCYPVYGMVHIKEPLLLIVKSSPRGGSGFSLSLFEWTFIWWDQEDGIAVKGAQSKVKWGVGGGGGHGVNGEGMAPQAPPP